MKKLVLVLLLVFLVGCSGVNFECESDDDCFKATCCHASSCSTAQPDCTMVACTEECAPDTLDCCGKCICNNGQCEGVMADF